MRRWLTIVALLVASTGSMAATNDETRQLKRAMAEADRGTAALEKGNLTKAKESFDRALVELPDFPQAHLGLGHIAMREKRFDDALREFRTAEQGYKSMSALTVQLEADRYSRSRDELQNLRSQLSELDGAAMQNQTTTSGSGPGQTEGQIERQRSQVRSRIQALEAMNPPSSTAVKEAPAEVFFFEGNALFNLKRTDEAIAAWQTALKRDAKQPLAENNLAVACWMTGRLDEAKAAMERAEALGFKVNPNFRADLEKALAARH
jgi:tetratricopeptide (TPR) repeat protein